MDIVALLRDKTPFVFAKFGDGEYFAATGCAGGNCDGTPYTQILGQEVRRAIEVLKTAYIGKWVDSPQVAPYFQSICSAPIRWENYNIFIFRTYHEYYTRCLPIYRAIRMSPQQKIYICNEYMVDGTREFLNMDAHVVVHSRNWFEHDYAKTLECLKTRITTDSPIILLSAGMGAKPLIADIVKAYPTATVLDIGSALDLVCSSRRTRDYHRLTEAEIQCIKRSLE